MTVVEMEHSPNSPNQWIGTTHEAIHDKNQGTYPLFEAPNLGGRIPAWKYNESPLVDGEKLVCTPGGEESLLVALDKLTGKMIWKRKMPGSADGGSGATAGPGGSGGRGGRGGRGGLGSPAGSVTPGGASAIRDQDTLFRYDVKKLGS